MLRLSIIFCLFLFLSNACQIPEERVKTVIVVDEITKDRSNLSDNQIIESDLLQYTLQYRVYAPAGYPDMEDLPSIYFLDGQWFIEDGEVPKLLDQLIEQEKIEPVIAVFIDSRDPRYLKKNRRNDEFLGNEKYIQFLKSELVPRIDASYRTSPAAPDRVLAGISFGATCASFAGLKASDTFTGFGCQSPAMHPVTEIYTAYEESEGLPINFFLSTGTKNDKLDDTHRFREIFEDKGYNFIYREVPEGHTWANWKPLLDDLVIYFFGG